MNAEIIPPERFVTFGQLLRHLRKRARLTLRALSIATGYSEGHLANLERDARRPDLATIQARLLPVLDLADAPAWAARLLELAAGAGISMRDGSAVATSSEMSVSQPDPVDASSFDLLTAKLFVPQPRPNSVPRPRLLERLDQALTVPLTLVAAPAGAGKTTLLAAWCRHVQSSDHPAAQPVAWLSLDPDDNDLPIFVRYLVAACQRLAPHAGAAALALLPQAQQLPPAVLLRPLLNDLAAIPCAGVLILDDCHVLTAPAVCATLLFFLDHLPPELHLVIASREDPPLPLARLRARGALVELRTRDLSFTTAESTVFLRTTMGLPIASEHVAVLERRTEGWAAGLQLAALALQDRPDHADIVADLSSTSRYLVDYLGDEVLGRLPQYLRAFVLQTSILDRMCGELCDALLLGAHGEAFEASPPADQAGSPQPAAYSQQLLDELHRRHVFVVPLDATRRWYRYHQLFADVMRAKVRADATAVQIATLYRRASRWHEEQGMVGDAIRYALAAGLAAEAIRLVEQQAAAMIEQSRYGELSGWLKQLPETIIWTRSRLCIAQSIILMVTDPTRCMPFLERAVWLAQRSAPTVDAVAEPGSIDGSSTWLDDVPVVAMLVRGIVARGGREYARAVELLEQAIAGTKPSFSFLRGRAQLQLGIVHLLRGALSTAETHFRRLLEPSEYAPAPGVLQVEAAACLGDILIMRGSLREAAALCERTLAQYPQPHIPALGMIHLSLSDVYYEWNDLTRADQHLQRGFELGERLASLPWWIRGYYGRARVLLARGDMEAARTSSRKVQELIETLGAIISSPRPPPLGKVLLALDDVAATETWMQGRGVRLDQAATADTEHEQLVAARLLLTRRQWNAAIEHTDRLLVGAIADERISGGIEALILQALAYLAQGQRGMAVADVTRALHLAAPGEYIRIFVDEGAPIAALLQDVVVEGAMQAYQQRVLAAFPDHTMNA